MRKKYGSSWSSSQLVSDVPSVVFTVGDVYHHEKTPWLWTHPAWQILNAGLANRAIGAGNSRRWWKGGAMDEWFAIGTTYLQLIRDVSGLQKRGCHSFEAEATQMNATL